MQNMKNNRSFVQLPLQKSVEKIKEKEEVCKERRIKRGLFRSNTGVLINAENKP